MFHPNRQRPGLICHTRSAAMAGWSRVAGGMLNLRSYVNWIESGFCQNGCLLQGTLVRLNPWNGWNVGRYLIWESPLDISFLIFPRSGWIMLDWWELPLWETGREQNHVSLSWSVQKYFMAWYSYSTSLDLFWFFHYRLDSSRWILFLALFQAQVGLPEKIRVSSRVPVKHATFKSSYTLCAVQNPGCLDYTV